jgi:hypothetical protein
METEDPLFHAQMAYFHAAMAMGPFCKSEKRLKQIAGQVALLIHDGGPQIIEGVQFDFRSPLLNPDEWGLNAFSDMLMFIPGLGSASAIREVPSFWFPWFGEYHADNYAKRVSAHHNSDFQRELRSTDESKTAAKYTRSELDRIVEANKPTYIVNVGDTVRIYSVTNRMLGDNVEYEKLEHDHDAIIKEVILEIFRKNGDLEIVQQPFIIVGHRALISQESEYTDYLMGILWRMVAFFKLDKISQLSNVISDKSIHARAAATGIDLHKILDPLSDIQYDATEEGESAKFVVNIANQAAMLGFLWAKAEAESDLSHWQKLRFNAATTTRLGAQRAEKQGAKRPNKDGYRSLRRWPSRFASNRLICRKMMWSTKFRTNGRRRSSNCFTPRLRRNTSELRNSSSANMPG